MEIRESWLAQVQEDVLDPERPLVDPHHHFFSAPAFGGYGLEDLWRDTSRHRVVRTVYMECGEHYRKGGPEALAPVGETEWVHAIATRAEQGPSGAARIGGIVGTADLCLGARVQEVLEAHLEASSRFRGIRDSTAWADGEGVLRLARAGHAEQYADAGFREGFARLAPLGLSYDAYSYHTQLDGLRDLARAFPDTSIVVDHTGGPLGVGSFAGKREQVFAEWRRGMSELASCPNVYVKLGGMAMWLTGFGFEAEDRPPGSERLASAHADYYHSAIDAFGPERCMFESNFPVEKLAVDYDVLWNGFKRVASRYGEAERDNLLCGSAARFYRIDLPG